MLSMVSRRSTSCVLATCRALSCRTLTSGSVPTASTAALRPAADAALKEATPVSPASTPTPDAPLSSRTDEELLELILDGRLSVHSLEAVLGDCTRAVHLRRMHLAHKLSVLTTPTMEPSKALKELPISAFNEDAFYKSVLGTNCEAVIGYLPLPVGVVGPLDVDGSPRYVPLATTEGALIASTNRGARAITRAGGVSTSVFSNGMTRAPVLKMQSLADVGALTAWLADADNYAKVEAAFNSTSRFGRLQAVSTTAAGRNLYVRFRCATGDAMGMNMITKGVNEALGVLLDHFPTAEVKALSGNFCTDKKPSAVNWVEGRGKSVAAEAVIPKAIVTGTLKTTVADMVELNKAKNLVGSAMAGSIGGFNAHASNIVTALFLATGQDAAQNVESSNCITLMEACPTSGDLIVSVTMPSIEVGTVGGGTSLPAQGACLDLLGVRGAHADTPGANAEQLARVCASAVLAGELSLMAALCSGDLVSSHLRLNRKEETRATAAAEAEAFAAVAPTAGGAGAGAGASAAPATPAITTARYSTAASSPGRHCFTTTSSSGASPSTPRLSVP